MRLLLCMKSAVAAAIGSPATSRSALLIMSRYREVAGHACAQGAQRGQADRHIRCYQYRCSFGHGGIQQ